MPEYEVYVSLCMGETYKGIAAESCREAEQKAKKKFCDDYGMEGRAISWFVECESDESDNDDGTYDVEVYIDMKVSYDIDASSSGQAELEAEKSFIDEYDLDNTGAAWNVCAEAEEIEEDIDEEEEDE